MELSKRLLVFRKYGPNGPTPGNKLVEVEVDVSTIAETSESYHSEGYELEWVLLPSEYQ